MIPLPTTLPIPSVHIARVCTYPFVPAMAGGLRRGFEEAARALLADDRANCGEPIASRAVRRPRPCLRARLWRRAVSRAVTHGERR